MRHARLSIDDILQQAQSWHLIAGRYSAIVGNSRQQRTVSIRQEQLQFSHPKEAFVLQQLLANTSSATHGFQTADCLRYSQQHWVQPRGYCIPTLPTQCNHHWVIEVIAEIMPSASPGTYYIRGPSYHVNMNVPDKPYVDQIVTSYLHVIDDAWLEQFFPGAPQQLATSQLLGLSPEECATQLLSLVTPGQSVVLPSFDN